MSTRPWNTLHIRTVTRYMYTKRLKINTLEEAENRLRGAWHVRNGFLSRDKIEARDEAELSISCN